jgi:hypothetical protein
LFYILPKHTVTLAGLVQSSFISSTDQLAATLVIFVLEQKECLEVAGAVCAVATWVPTLPAHERNTTYGQLVILCEPVEQALPHSLEPVERIKQFCS